MPINIKLKITIAISFFPWSEVHKFQTARNWLRVISRYKYDGGEFLVIKKKMFVCRGYCLVG